MNTANFEYFETSSSYPAYMSNSQIDSVISTLPSLAGMGDYISPNKDVSMPEEKGKLHGKEIPIGDINSAGIEGINALARFEAEVMSAVWDLQRQVSVSEIQERMIENKLHTLPAGERVQRIAYTSVLTTVTRLTEKGYLKQDRAPLAPTSRNAYMYSPTMTRYEYRVMMAKALAKAAMEIEPLAANEVFNQARAAKTTRKGQAKGEGAAPKKTEAQD